MTAADTQVGDADVSGRSEGGLTAPLRGYPPFLGRRVCTYLGNHLQGKASGVSRNRAGWIPESGRSDPGISSSDGIPSSEDLAGAEDIAGAVENWSV